MRILLLALLVVAAQSVSAQMIAIESCDGSGRKTYIGPVNVAGEEYLTIAGRLVDAVGEPVCGAWVAVTYVGEKLDVPGAQSPTGRNGEFVLTSLRKGATISVDINPYFEAECDALHPIASDNGGVEQGSSMTRRSGLRPYRAVETLPEAEAGVVERIFVLESDPRATEVVRGHISGLEPGMSVSGELVGAIDQPIRIHVNPRTGSFVAFGVAVGDYRLNLRRHKGQTSASISATVAVRRGKPSPDILLTEDDWIASKN